MINKMYYKYTSSIYELFGKTMIGFAAGMIIMNKLMSVIQDYAFIQQNFYQLFFGTLASLVIAALYMVFYWYRNSLKMKPKNVKYFYILWSAIGSVYLSFLVFIPTKMMYVVDLDFNCFLIRSLLILGGFSLIISLFARFGKDVFGVKAFFAIILSVFSVFHIIGFYAAVPMWYACVPLIYMTLVSLLFLSKHKTLLALEYANVQEKDLFKLSVLFFVKMKTNWFTHAKFVRNFEEYKNYLNN